MRLPDTWELPDKIRERFGKQTSGRQRAMFADDHLLLVLHKAPGPDDIEREAAFFWRHPTGEWRCSGRGSGLGALQKHIEEYDQKMDQIDDLFEKAQQAAEYFEILQQVAPLKRAAGHMLQTLQAAREAVHGDRDIIGLRDQAYEVDRGFELLYTDVKNALDFSIARKAEEQAKLSEDSVRVGNRLNILAAVFFPLTAIASVFGMNLTHGLENGPVHRFWAVMVLSMILGFVIRGWILRGTVRT